MSLTPLLETSWFIQVHTALALVAVALGPFVIHRQRRDRLHKVTGYIWVSAMLGVAISAFFIPSTVLPILGPFGPIHLLAVLAIINIVQGMRAIYRRNIRGHEAALKGLYWQGLAIAGLLTVLPGRVLNEVLFPSNPMAGWGLVALGGGVILWMNLSRRERSKTPRGQGDDAWRDFA